MLTGRSRCYLRPAPVVAERCEGEVVPVARLVSGTQSVICAGDSGIGEEIE